MVDVCIYYLQIKCDSEGCTKACFVKAELEMKYRLFFDNPPVRVFVFSINMYFLSAACRSGSWPLNLYSL